MGGVSRVEVCTEVAHGKLFHDLVLGKWQRFRAAGRCGNERSLPASIIVGPGFPAAQVLGRMVGLRLRGKVTVT